MRSRRTSAGDSRGARRRSGVLRTWASAGDAAHTSKSGAAHGSACGRSHAGDQPRAARARGASGSAARCAARSYCALLPSRGERRPVDGELEIHSAFAVEVAKFEVEDEDANQESSLRQESR
jgi:hypothetical protein